MANKRITQIEIEVEHDKIVMIRGSVGYVYTVSQERRFLIRRLTRDWDYERKVIDYKTQTGVVQDSALIEYIRRKDYDHTQHTIKHYKKRIPKPIQTPIDRLRDGSGKKLTEEDCERLVDIGINLLSQNPIADRVYIKTVDLDRFISVVQVALDYQAEIDRLSKSYFEVSR